MRKSLGARRRDILNQFLVESLVLSATGGVIGVLGAWGVAVLVRRLTPVPMAMPYNAVLIGVGLLGVLLPGMLDQVQLRVQDQTGILSLSP